MKNIFAITVLLFVNSIFAQEEQAVLYFKDGSEIEGFGMIKSGLLGDKDVIKFRVSSNSDSDIWDSEMVSSITFIANGEREEFYYVKLSKNSLYPRLLKIFSEGKVMLYGDIERRNLLNNSVSTVSSPAFGTGESSALFTNRQRNKSSIYQNEDPKQVTFYAKRESEKYPTKLTGTLSGWKKLIKEYFKDCNAIKERIDDRTYKINNIVEIVDIYNDDCLD